ncbi:GAF domain-containing sensor histidine kinase [Lottiidibacillus patelloidae]|uniref:GAF domain-containing sensor histidine kinase n=1 Tax=Lottiidibacillus patelloidae TaxID=2670334 RepID=UPI001E546F75|nr:GAF domain-containing sensor histidine kinase [Lottiidibacillus patelloidae]
MNEKRIQELKTLKVIAETLNQATDLQDMLQSVLEELLKVTGLTTGWVFLIEENRTFTLEADSNLPPALLWQEKRPMCEGGCWCVNRFSDGRLQEAVNIIECKRIEDAIENKWGATEGITHHATVPLQAGTEKFGLLNVAAPNKKHFSDEELALLQSVSFQIGTAIKRMKLYQSRKKRIDMLQKLGEFNAKLNVERHEEQLQQKAVKMIANTFQWAQVSLTINGEKDETVTLRDIEDAKEIKMKIKTGNTEGKLIVSNETFDDIDKDVITQLIDHIGITFENVRLDQRGREITLIQERNRLARDLHDSVNQLMFSLMLTVRGTKEMTNDPELLESLNYMQELSQEALKEMRALIWQLKPEGLEDGVVAALMSYGKILGLTIDVDVEGVSDLPSTIEECLWRIGQEAFNNIKKYAGTKQAIVSLHVSKTNVVLTVADKGTGFEIMAGEAMPSFGLRSMKERAELLGGTVEVISEKGKGTKIIASIPL